VANSTVNQQSTGSFLWKLPKEHCSEDMAKVLKAEVFEEIVLAG
jgi:hypothetical protein